MKIMTVLGTRPEIIRLSLLIKLLDRHADHLVVHTGQNYADCLTGRFFRELQVRDPDLFLNVRGGSFGEQVSQILAAIEPVFREHRPDRVLILGDTNSGLTALVARRLGLPVYHMEAGNRCYDDRVPEELNRRVIDHSSSVLMPYTNRSRENLLREGFAGERILVTGNPIKEVIEHYRDRIAVSSVHADLGLEEKKFFLVTMHRAENVDLEERLRTFVDAFTLLHQRYGFPVVCSLHPRTRAKAESFGVDLDRDGLLFVEPLGFADFVRLEQTAFCILTDSGTVQEEACIFGAPNVTIRDVTERPETIECGSNVLAGCDVKKIEQMVELVTSERRKWQPPAEYLAENVSATVARILLGFHLSPNGRRASVRVADGFNSRWQRHRIEANKFRDPERVEHNQRIRGANPH